MLLHLVRTLSCARFSQSLSVLLTVQGFAVVTASGAVLTYEMGVAPDAEPVPMTRAGDGFGSQAAGDFCGPNFAGFVNGFAGCAGRFVDSGATGTNGYYKDGFAGAWTADLRISVEVSTGGTGTIGNMNVAQASGNRGRAIAFLNSNDAGLGGPVAAPNAFRLQIRHSGVIDEVNVPNNPANSTSFHMIRMVVPNNDHLLVYDLENDTDPGPGVSWALLLDSAGISGGTGRPSVFAANTGGISLGGIHSSSETTAGRQVYDWVRIHDGAALGATDPIMAGTPPASCSPSTCDCAASVTPVPTQTRVGYENGILDPDNNEISPIPYSFNNLSPANAITNYTVAEVDALGEATDYTWLSVPPGEQTGNIDPASSTTVTAHLTTAGPPNPGPGLAPGVYSGYLKFDDTCGPSAPCASDSMTYADGALVGNDGWTGTATSTEIGVAAGEVQLASGNNAGGGGNDPVAILPVTCAEGANGVISISIQARAGGGSENTVFSLWFESAAGAPLGRWAGSGAEVRAQGGNGVTANYPLPAAGPGTYAHLEARINVIGNVIEYRVDGVSIGTYTLLSAAPLGRIRFQRLDDNNTASAETVFFDDLQVNVLVRHIRRIDLTVRGCEVEVQEPRRLDLGSCDSSSVTTHTFTIRNIGAYDWTGFRAFEFNDDDDWLTLSYENMPAGLPVVRNGTATVTATIDWSAAPVTIAGDDLIGVIRFAASCDNGATEVFDTPADTITINDNVANPPLIARYEGNVLPNVPNSGGPGFTFVLLADGSAEQGSIVSDVGLDGALDGLAYRLVDGPTARTRWRVSPSANIGNAAGATVVARVKTVSVGGDPSGNLFIFADPTGGGSDGISASAHWAGAAGQVVETDRGVAMPATGDGNYHIIRLTSQALTGLGNVIRVYVDENPTPVLEITNAGSVGSDAGLDAVGFGAGDTEGQQEIYFDCFYGTNAGAFAPGEEDDCIGSLVCVPSCNHPFADADPVPDGDGDVDVDDFAFFQRCYTGPDFAGVLSPECKCFDQDSTGASAGSVDSRDFLKFVACQSGANVPWVPTVACP